MSARIGLAAAFALAAVSWARAEGAPPDATSLLFDEPQLSQTRPGEVLLYRFTRRSADEAQFGPGFEDQIRLTVDKAGTDATRTINADVFSGARRRPAGPFTEMTGNPILTVMLEQNIEGLSRQLGGNPLYFKSAIRRALRDKATVTPDTVRVGDHSEPAWRVSITPFKDDPNRSRMRGLDALDYQFEVAKAIPGEILEIRISAPAATGGPLLEERIDYVPETP